MHRHKKDTVIIKQEQDVIQKVHQENKNELWEIKNYSRNKKLKKVLEDKVEETSW